MEMHAANEKSVGVPGDLKTLLECLKIHSEPLMTMVAHSAEAEATAGKFAVPSQVHADDFIYQWFRTCRGPGSRTGTKRGRLPPNIISRMATGRRGGLTI